MLSEMNGLSEMSNSLYQLTDKSDHKQIALPEAGMSKVLTQHKDISNYYSMETK